MITLKSISKTDFYTSNLPVVFHDESYARHYYCLYHSDVEMFVFSAQSEVSPVTLVIGRVIVVGCDQSVAFFNIDDHLLLKRLSLSCFLYNIDVAEKYIFIVCEVEVVILYRNTLNEYKFFGFTEYIDHIEINNGEVSVIFIDGTCENIHI
ncbi:hypothetical protein SJI19_22155 [Acerihabitans sp. TG2]|uniref:hypothetical protein n=1 Tax=Acerihabitans sp. TG2 TaxID=3096008 RepID=UPI002B229949|nr:hypothetical protein [Acerihabitans sp. TG2]MEA9393209.1 hypothetical protein [Acerihabitans sp. TG2]